MKKKDSINDNMREYYDFSKGVRGKYAKRYKKGSNVVVLEPDVAKRFPNSDSVNKALREIAPVTPKADPRKKTTSSE
jgi:hypothetical protein